MNKRRLLKMADFVETIPPKKFHMSAYMIDSDCGTIGCAMGWAAEKKLFSGLTTPDFPTFKDCRGIYAAARLFNISEDVAWELFDYGPKNETPKQVARNIRRYVETGELP